MRENGKEYTEEDMAIMNEPLQPSVLGKLVRCKYYLEMKLAYGGMTCCLAAPSSINPLAIYSGEIRA